MPAGVGVITVSGKDAIFGVAAFAAMVAVALLATYGPGLIAAIDPAIALFAPPLILAAVIAVTGKRRRHWNPHQPRERDPSIRFFRETERLFALARPEIVSRPYVIDGDTIDAIVSDGSVVRFRLANIDAPETDDNAKCAHERLAGDLAKYEARAMVQRAAAVTVQPTLRIDIYGRRVAFVRIDDEDLGDSLVRKGLAQNWAGRRERWCGPNGGLAKMAARRGQTHNCAICKNWS